MERVSMNNIELLNELLGEPSHNYNDELSILKQRVKVLKVEVKDLQDDKKSAKNELKKMQGDVVKMQRELDDMKAKHHREFVQQLSEHHEEMDRWENVYQDRNPELREFYDAFLSRLKEAGSLYDRIVLYKDKMTIKQANKALKNIEISTLCSEVCKVLNMRDMSPQDGISLSYNHRQTIHLFHNILWHHNSLLTQTCRIIDKGFTPAEATLLVIFKNDPEINEDNIHQICTESIGNILCTI